MNKIILLILVIFVFSCENEPPYIYNPTFNILTYQAGAGAGPNTSVFLSVHFVLTDDNGLGDIQNIILIHPEEELVWRLTLDDLEETIYGETTYYGYSFFEYDNASSVILGDYVIRAIDSAGNESDITLSVELEGVTSKIYKPSVPEYEIILKEGGKELTLEKFKYSAVEIKVVNQPELYNNTRKKFIIGEKIMISDNELSTGSILSLRVNSYSDERLVYFLKNYVVR